MPKLSPKGIEVINLLYFEGYTQRQLSDHLKYNWAQLKPEVEIL